MNALYLMRFTGAADLGGGVLYIGKYRILGMDTALCRYEGTYTIDGNAINAKATLTVPANGVILVTGLPVPGGSRIGIQASLPEEFDDGKSHTIRVGTLDTQVAFEKIGDIPL